MKLFYEEPEISIRKYDFPSNALFTESVTEPPDKLSNVVLSSFDIRPSMSAVAFGIAFAEIATHSKPL